MSSGRGYSLPHGPFSLTLVHAGALERISADDTDLSFELGSVRWTMARGLWHLAHLAAAHSCARGICNAIFQRPWSPSGPLAATGGGAYLAVIS